MKLSRALISVFLVSASLSAPAATQETRRLGKFKSWLAVESHEDNDRVCYARSKPSSKKGKYRKRDATYVNVIYRADRRHNYEFTVVAGYNYNWRSTVRVNIDGRRFRLFTDKDLAWISTPKRGADLVRAMRKGRWMVVRGRSSRGTLTTDTYSLVGFTAAQRAIARACKGK